MENNQKDKGLRKSLANRQQSVLSENFTFRTMQMIEQDIALREKRFERTLQYIVIAATVMLPIMSIAIIYYFVDSNIILGIRDTLQESFGCIKITLPALSISLMLVLLLFLDSWTRRQYYNKQYKDYFQK